MEKLVIDVMESAEQDEWLAGQGFSKLSL